MHPLRLEIKLAEDGWVSFYAVRGHKVTSERHCQPTEDEFIDLYIKLRQRNDHTAHRSLASGSLLFIKQTKL